LKKGTALGVQSAGSHESSCEEGLIKRVARLLFF
jgi:hypothetical protein